MVHPRLLSKYVAQSLTQSRSFCISSPTRSSQVSVAKLLGTSPENINEAKINVNGFIRSIRNQKRLSFASIGDGSSVQPLQALLTPQQAERSGNHETKFLFHFLSIPNRTIDFQRVQLYALPDTGNLLRIKSHKAMNCMYLK